MSTAAVEFVAAKTIAGKLVNNTVTAQIRQIISDFYADEEFLYLWMDNKKWFASLPQTDYVFVALTNYRAVKVQKDRLEAPAVYSELLCSIKYATHLKLGFTKWDKLKIYRANGETEELGIRDGDSCAFLCKALNSAITNKKFRVPPTAQQQPQQISPTIQQQAAPLIASNNSVVSMHQASLTSEATPAYSAGPISPKAALNQPIYSPPLAVAPIVSVSPENPRFIKQASLTLGDSVPIHASAPYEFIEEPQNTANNGKRSSFSAVPQQIPLNNAQPQGNSLVVHPISPKLVPSHANSGPKSAAGAPSAYSVEISALSPVNSPENIAEKAYSGGYSAYEMLDNPSEEPVAPVIDRKNEASAAMKHNNYGGGANNSENGSNYAGYSSYNAMEASSPSAPNYCHYSVPQVENNNQYSNQSRTNSSPYADYSALSEEKTMPLNEFQVPTLRNQRPIGGRTSPASPADPKIQQNHNSLINLSERGQQFGILQRELDLFEQIKGFYAEKSKEIAQKRAENSVNNLPKTLEQAESFYNSVLQAVSTQKDYLASVERQVSQSCAAIQASAAQEEAHVVQQSSASTRHVVTTYQATDGRIQQIRQKVAGLIQQQQGALQQAKKQLEESQNQQKSASKWVDLLIIEQGQAEAMAELQKSFKYLQIYNDFNKTVYLRAFSKAFLAARNLLSAPRAELPASSGSTKPNFILNSSVERDWTREWLEVVHLPQETPSDRVFRSNSIDKISSEFALAASNIATVIIEEFHLLAVQKSIKAVAAGGIAGGEKYMQGGIFFKFALDIHNLYGGNEAAQKSASHELKGMRAFFGSGVKGLDCPLVVIIDYLGYRIMATSLLPLAKNSLVYGSQDQCRTVHSSNEMCNKLMEIAGEKLNLKPHKVGPAESPVELVGPGDIEVHMASLTNKTQFFVLDTARTAPAEAPTQQLPVIFLSVEASQAIGVYDVGRANLLRDIELLLSRLDSKNNREIATKQVQMAGLTVIYNELLQNSADSSLLNLRASKVVGNSLFGSVFFIPAYIGSHLYQLLRLEYVRQFSLPLSSDAFSFFGRDSAAQHNAEVRSATTLLHSHHLIQFSRDLLASATLPPTSSALISAMHTAGLNVRLLGKLRAIINSEKSSTKREKISEMLLTEMVARIYKNIIRRKLRNLDRKAVENAANLREKLRVICLDELNYILAVPRHEKGKITWNESLKTQISCKFGLYASPFTPEELEISYDLAEKLSKYKLFQTLSNQLGLQFTTSTWQKLNSSAAYEKEQPLQLKELLQINPSIETLQKPLNTRQLVEFLRREHVKITANHAGNHGMLSKIVEIVADCSTTLAGGYLLLESLLFAANFADLIESLTGSASRINFSGGHALLSLALLLVNLADSETRSTAFISSNSLRDWNELNNFAMSLVGQVLGPFGHNQTEKDNNGSNNSSNHDNNDNNTSVTEPIPVEILIPALRVLAAVEKNRGNYNSAYNLIKQALSYLTTTFGFSRGAAQEFIGGHSSFLPCYFQLFSLISHLNRSILSDSQRTQHSEEFNFLSSQFTPPATDFTQMKLAMGGVAPNWQDNHNSIAFFSDAVQNYLSTALLRVTLTGVEFAFDLAVLRPISAASEPNSGLSEGNLRGSYLLPHNSSGAISLAANSEPFTTVFCGEFGVAGLSSAGDVYCSGELSRYIGGNSAGSNDLSQFSLCPALVGKEIASIAINRSAALFLTRNGLCYSCGLGTAGLLGQGDLQDRTSPRIIQALQNQQISKVYLSNNNKAAAINIQGQLFVWYH
jgi:hypothetical protein